MTDLTATPRLNSTQRQRVRSLTSRLLAQAREQTAAKLKWQYLEAAHIAGQTEWASHLRTHCAMLAQALREGNFSEVAAQLLRLAVVPLGHLFNRLPVGNPGSGRVNAFKPALVESNVAEIIRQASRH